MSRPMPLETLWDEQVLAAVELLCATRTIFTVEDVRELVTEPEPHPNAWGTVFRRKYVRGLVQATGHPARTHRPSAHGRWVFSWAPRGTA